MLAGGPLTPTRCSSRSQPWAMRSTPSAAGARQCPGRRWQRAGVGGARSRGFPGSRPTARLQRNVQSLSADLAQTLPCLLLCLGWEVGELCTLRLATFSAIAAVLGPGAPVAAPSLARVGVLVLMAVPTHLPVRCCHPSHDDVDSVTRDLSLRGGATSPGWRPSRWPASSVIVEWCNAAVREWHR